MAVRESPLELRTGGVERSESVGAFSDAGSATDRAGFGLLLPSAILYEPKQPHNPD